MELRENLVWIIIRTFFSGQRIGMCLSTDLLNSVDMHGIFIKNSHGYNYRIITISFFIYVERGKMIHLDLPDNMDEELRQMNNGKNGHPFVYSECLVMAIIGIRLQLGIALRCAEGMTIAALGEEYAPDHVTLWRRTKSLDVSFTDRTVTVKSKSSILQFIIDGTGMSPSAKGDYIRHKYKIKTKSGFMRLSVMIEQDTMQVLGFTVTDETIGDSPQFEPLIKQALKSKGIDPDARRAVVMEAGAGPPLEPPRIEIRADAGYQRFNMNI